MAEARDFKFGTLFCFAKAHPKITLKDKSGRGPGLGDLTKIWGFPFNIFATAEANNFKIGTVWVCQGLHKRALSGKCVWLWLRKALQFFSVPFTNSEMAAVAMVLPSNIILRTKRKY